jgi:hypothetical protein
MNKQQVERLNQLRALGRMLDSRFESPMGLRFGLDGLLGLIPVVGDLVTSAMSLYIIGQAAALGCAPPTLVRMALNVMIENLVDMIPLVGNIFDFVFKANLRNLALLESHLTAPQKVTWQSRIMVGFIALVLMVVLVGTGYVAFKTLFALWNWITTHA